MNVIFEHKVWLDMQHMKYSALFRKDPIALCNKAFNRR